MATDRQQIENFLYHEARLMDESAYDAWLELYAEDGLYWVPCNEDDVDPLLNPARGRWRDPEDVQLDRLLQQLNPAEHS